MTSIRLDADTMQGLDMLVGDAGLNTRSDVIRLAIQQLLHGQAQLPGMKSVRIPIGRMMEQNLAALYELYGTSHEQAASEGMHLYIKQKLAEAETEQTKLQQVVDQTRDATMKRKEYHQ
ncbi:MAG: ribbon-helix-helix protein, CopG family [Euryarchaeota archaeon]|nr:ribbon-helix-helix protein, CopG family [Euryarchaeota archaeon]